MNLLMDKLLRNCRLLAGCFAGISLIVVSLVHSHRAIDRLHHDPDFWANLSDRSIEELYYQAEARVGSIVGGGIALGFLIRYWFVNRKPPT